MESGHIAFRSDAILKKLASIFNVTISDIQKPLNSFQREKELLEQFQLYQKNAGVRFFNLKKEKKETYLSLSKKTNISKSLLNNLGLRISNINPSHLFEIANAFNVDIDNLWPKKDLIIFNFPEKKFNIKVGKENTNLSA